MATYLLPSNCYLKTKITFQKRFLINNYYAVGKYSVLKKRIFHVMVKIKFKET